MQYGSGFSSESEALAKHLDGQLPPPRLAILQSRDWDRRGLIDSFFGYLTNLFQLQRLCSVELYENITMNGEQVKIQKEAVVTNLETARYGWVVECF
jgi:hypothetical protein